MNTAIIPARGGSRRIKRKNIREFYGKPIIAYSIEAAKKSGLFDKIIISSDHTEIIDIAMEYGATDYHDRPDELAVDEIGTQEVIRDVLLNCEINNDYICCIYATTPLMSVDDLKRGYDAIYPGVDHAISIGYPPLRDAAQFYWSTIKALLNDVQYFGCGTRLIKIDADRVCDINVEDDWKQAEEMYVKLHA